MVLRACPRSAQYVGANTWVAPTLDADGDYPGQLDRRPADHQAFDW
jgi:hypothetical protein